MSGLSLRSRGLALKLCRSRITVFNLDPKLSIFAIAAATSAAVYVEPLDRIDVLIVPLRDLAEPEMPWSKAWIHSLAELLVMPLGHKGHGAQQIA